MNFTYIVFNEFYILLPIFTIQIRENFKVFLKSMEISGFFLLINCYIIELIKLKY
jgi:hypothetical protein